MLSQASPLQCFEMLKSIYLDLGLSCNRRRFEEHLYAHQRSAAASISELHRFRVQRHALQLAKVLAAYQKLDTFERLLCGSITLVLCNFALYHTESDFQSNEWLEDGECTDYAAAAAAGSSALCEYLCAAVGPVVSQNTAQKHAAALHLRLCRKQLHLRQTPPPLFTATHVSEDHLPLSFYSGMLHLLAKPERHYLATGVTAPEQQPSRPCCSGRAQREAPWLPASAAGLRRYREGAPRCVILDVRELWVKGIGVRLWPASDLGTVNHIQRVNF